MSPRQAWWMDWTGESSTEPTLIHYQTLRRSIGYLGILLPWVLWGGSLVLGHCDHVQPSISHYYYSNMREIFVGILFAVSLFLFTYNGHGRLDMLISKSAALCALLVALFPTDYLEDACQLKVTSFWEVSFHSVIHLGAASVFFVLLSVMSIWVFTRSRFENPMERTPQKRWRNRIYRTCGIVMLTSLVAIATYFLTDGNPRDPVVFAMESLALTAFGISWLAKGEAIGLLRDQAG